MLTIPIFETVYPSGEEVRPTLSAMIACRSQGLLTPVEQSTINALEAAYTRRGTLDSCQAMTLVGLGGRLNRRLAERGSDLIALCRERAQRVPPPIRKPRQDDDEEPQPPRAASTNPGLIEMCRQRAAETGRAL